MEASDTCHAPLPPPACGSAWLPMGVARGAQDQRPEPGARTRLSSDSAFLISIHLLLNESKPRNFVPSRTLAQKPLGVIINFFHLS